MIACFSSMAKASPVRRAAIPAAKLGADVLGVESLATHHLTLDEAPHGYDVFQRKAEGCVKVVLRP